MGEGFARGVDLRKLNSMTKYPSIPTYHELGDKGNLTESAMLFDQEVFLTEKVDGTNARIILLPDQTFILGSREELIYAQGDLIRNPVEGIVETLHDDAEKIVVYEPLKPIITVFYVEVYGGKVGKNAKQYTANKEYGFRLFDVLDIHNHNEILKWDIAKISSWRENGGQQFAPVSTVELVEVTLQADVALKRVPQLMTMQGSSLPLSIDDTLDFLKTHLQRTKCAIDDGAGGKSEGLVVRTADRSKIAKMRFQDYERTIRRR